MLRHDLIHTLLAPFYLRAQLVNHFALFLGLGKQAFVCLQGLLFGVLKFLGNGGQFLF
jgi:hypothetical protein